MVRGARARMLHVGGDMDHAGRGGVKWGRKWDDGPESRAGWEIRRTEVSQEGESLLGALYFLKSICGTFSGAVGNCPAPRK